MSTIQTANAKTTSIERLMARHEKERGFKFIPLETGALLRRVSEGGHSGDYLAHAYLSAYYQQNFNHSLGDSIHLDSEALRLLQQIMHIRHVKGWSDALYNTLAQEIKNILAKEERTHA